MTDLRAAPGRRTGEGEQYISDVEFERPGPLGRFVKTAFVNPMANYLPAGLTKAILRLTKSELAAANWADPGGWRSMVISYEGRPRQIADRVLVGGGAMAMALRNRRRLGAKVVGDLIDASGSEPVHVLCLGAGPGHIITDAMLRARKKSRATLVDLSGEAFEYGRRERSIASVTMCPGPAPRHRMWTGSRGAASIRSASTFAPNRRRFRRAIGIAPPPTSTRSAIWRGRPS